MKSHRQIIRSFGMTGANICFVIMMKFYSDDVGKTVYVTEPNIN
jgi:hypothetical protein